MLKQQANLFTKIAGAMDAVAIVTAFFAAYYIRGFFGDINAIGYYSWILFIVMPLWCYLFYRFQLYASLRTRTLPGVLFDIVKVHVIGSLVLSSIIYLLEPRGYSRGVFLDFIFLSIILISAEKLFLKVFLSYFRRKGYNFRNILIVGCNRHAFHLTRLIEGHAKWGLRVVGFLRLNTENRNICLNGYHVLGSLENLVEVCKQETIDEVVFCVPMEALPNLENHVKDMEIMGITVRMILNFYDLLRSKRELSLFHGQVPMLTLYPRSFDSGHLFVKRCMDLMGAAVGLLVTGLLFPFIALAIKMSTPGPLFFGQERVGEKGRRFMCWKFRSMHIDAEKRKRELMHLNEMNGAIFKIKNDPRITRVGAFLRKTSLDELPQFWNVLKGEMSLVGTRPPTAVEVSDYENWHRKRICIKPGITGLWQVNGRNEIKDFDQVARLDIEYIEKWSLWLDVKILVKTAWVVFMRDGSC